MKKIIIYLAGLIFALCVTSRYGLQQVAGSSMDPTFNDGDIILVDFKGIPKDQDIVILTTSYIENYEIEGEHIVKRYYEEFSTDGLYVLGDNAKVSYDSRYYGEAPKEALESVVICDISKIFR